MGKSTSNMNLTELVEYAFELREQPIKFHKDIKFHKNSMTIGKTWIYPERYVITDPAFQREIRNSVITVINKFASIYHDKRCCIHIGVNKTIFTEYRDFRHHHPMGGYKEVLHKLFGIKVQADEPIHMGTMRLNDYFGFGHLFPINIYFDPCLSQPNKINGGDIGISIRDVDEKEIFYTVYIKYLKDRFFAYHHVFNQLSREQVDIMCMQKETIVKIESMIGPYKDMRKKYLIKRANERINKFNSDIEYFDCFHHIPLMEEIL